VEILEWETEQLHVHDQRRDAGPHVSAGLLRLRCGHDIEGNCFLGGAGQRHTVWSDQILEDLAWFVSGVHFAERERLWGDLPRITGHSPSLRPGWAAIDIALWDMAGKHLDQPVSHLLGVARSELPMYATRPPVHDDPADAATDAAGFLDLGFAGYKLHPGRMPIDTVIEAVVSMREAVGDGFDLILDPGNGYSLEEALRVGGYLDDQHFLWFEDPIQIGSLHQLHRLAKALATPIAVSDSASFGLKEMAQLAGSGLYSTLRASSRWLGITGLKRACSLMEAFGGYCEIGLGGNPSMNAANLHVALSVTNTRHLEHWFPVSRHDFGVSETFATEGGVARLSNLPGLGLLIDEDWIADHRTRTLSPTGAQKGWTHGTS